MQVSFIMSLAALAAFSSAQAEKYSYGHAETAVKAVNPDLDDAAASEAASGYMHALAQLGDIGTDTDPKIVSILYILNRKEPHILIGLGCSRRLLPLLRN